MTAEAWTVLTFTFAAPSMFCASLMPGLDRTMAWALRIVALALATAALNPTP